MKWILPQNKPISLIEYLFESRGIVDRERFLNPEISHLVSPFEMYGVEDAVKVISDAIKSNQKIYIHGDFDVDGITATSIMWSFLYRDLNANVVPFVPNRFTDGYGLSEENIKNIISEGGGLLISVDCGIKDIELVNKYADKIDFIISDHHSIRKSDENGVEGSRSVGEFLVSSKAKAVVHPQLNPNLPFKEICGAFVSWKICSALNEYLRTGIDVNKYLDLVALGTVCDVMPLIEENRIIVRKGLEIMRKTENVGLKALFKVAGADISKAASYHLGFVIGPRLNASGRLETAMDAVRLLTTQSEKYALELAKKLDDLNKSRQELTKEYLEIAEQKILQDDRANKIHFVYGQDWPEGIVGLIAGRLAEKYNKPVLVGSSKEGIIKGSARSISVFNIAEAFKKLDSKLLRHGGHAQAAGFSLEETQYEEVLKNLIDLANVDILDEHLEKKLVIDSLVTSEDLTLDVARKLTSFEPFGNHNAIPVFALLSFPMKSNVKLMGKDQSHAKFCIDDGSRTECLFFNFKEKFDSLLYSTGKNVDMAGNIELDSWNGREKVVFKVKEMRVSE